MIALKKNLAPQKKSPTLTSLFFSSFPPCPSSFLLPYSNFWRCVPYLYISTSLHLSDTPPKIFRPCGAKREEEKERRREGERKKKKRTLLPTISVDRAVGPWWSLRRDFGSRSHIYNFPFLIYYPFTLIA